MIGLSKADQLTDNRKKKEPTFGKKPSPWRRDGKIKPKKVKKNDIIDNDYLNWLCTQPCVITGKRADRGMGAFNIHAHHIEGKNGTQNDHEAVPLLGSVHCWGLGSYHSTADSDFKKMYLPNYNGTVKEFFHECSRMLREKYKEEMSHE